MLVCQQKHKLTRKHHFNKAACYMGSDLVTERCAVTSLSTRKRGLEQLCHPAYPHC